MSDRMRACALAGFIFASLAGPAGRAQEGFVRGDRQHPSPAALSNLKENGKAASQRPVGRLVLMGQRCMLDINEDAGAVRYMWKDTFYKDSIRLIGEDLGFWYYSEDHEDRYWAVAKVKSVPGGLVEVYFLPASDATSGWVNFDEPRAWRPKFEPTPGSTP